jgi:hypothetical protein
VGSRAFFEVTIVGKQEQVGIYKSSRTASPARVLANETREFYACAGRISAKVRNANKNRPFRASGT